MPHRSVRTPHARIHHLPGADDLAGNRGPSTAADDRRSELHEVFFADVRIPDSARLGEAGAAWHAMMTTLAFERANAAEGLGSSGLEVVDRLVLTARQAGRGSDPVVRQRIAELNVRNRLRNWTAQRAEARLDASGIPGPEGSVAKLAYTRELQLTIAYAKKRTAFGRNLLQFQNTRFLLAECTTDVLTARTLADYCMHCHLAGDLDAATASEPSTGPLTRNARSSTGAFRSSAATAT